MSRTPTQAPPPEPAPSVPALPRHQATRYLVPLREGGSLPAVVETESGELFVVKFRGAGQGAKALVAEIIVAGLAAALDLPVPGIAEIELGSDFGRSEPDPEIQDILKGSRGSNFGLAYLDGALNYDPAAASDLVDEELASRLVWLDALVTNPDRSARNPNLLVHREQVWLIDHGAALFAHHSWERTDEERTRTAFPLSRDHVLLEFATRIEAVDAWAHARLGADWLGAVLDTVPDALLVGASQGTEEDAARARDRYLRYLELRLTPPRAWVTEAVEAHRARLENPPPQLPARR